MDMQQLGAAIANGLGYTAYSPGEQTGFLGSVCGYADPTYEPPVRRRIPNINNNYWKRMVIRPRDIFIAHPDFMVRIYTDSVGNIFLGVTGDYRKADEIWMPLLESETDPWPILRMAWNHDRTTRGTMRTFAPSSTTRSTLHPDELEIKSTTSTRQDTKTVPTFGDLSSLAKPSQRKT